jgi:hypothetical protein
VARLYPRLDLSRCQQAGSPHENRQMRQKTIVGSYFPPAWTGAEKFFIDEFLRKAFGKVRGTEGLIKLGNLGKSGTRSLCTATGR